MIDSAALKTAITQSAKEAFETMVFLPIEEIPDQPDNPEPATSLICTISFTGPYRGFFSIRSYMQSAERIAKSMLMAEEDQSLEDDEIFDALGEVTNLIIGGVKSRLGDSFGEIKISIPSTVKGVKVRPALGRSAERVNMSAKCNEDILKFELQYAAG